jgi:carbon monoxide dehydrogenase subunit G
MASVRTEFLVAARPEDIWAALRDFGAIHHRLAPGFVTEARLDSDTRIVTFVSGAEARERLIDIDDEDRRLVYSIVESPLGLTHHNASAQVFSAGEGRSRFVWVADLLPDELGATVSGLMEQGAVAMKRHLESQTATASPSHW